MEGQQGAVEIGSIHEHVIGDDEIKELARDIFEHRTRISGKGNSWIFLLCQFDHVGRDVDPCNVGAFLMELSCEISCATAGIKNVETLDFTNKSPEDWIRM